jgi:hypothetical protein
MGKNEAVLQLNCEPLAIELNLLLVGVIVVTTVLCQVVELMGVLVDRMISLAQIQELRKLAANCAR